ncbi:sphingosine-1-phosphate phosphatase 2 [Colletes latitarsis]|uniref:sphingosine-1-phosphate phosphatase 2 n=1 Tax=Colletes latitarsis TaxID=2605962 RepID=UPI00403533C1
MSKIVKHLRDASLVAKIQTAFGVKIHYRTNLKEHEDDSCNMTREIVSRELEHDLNNCSLNCEESKKNGHVLTEKKSVDFASTCASNDEQKRLSSIAGNPNYTISNYFWYYLFLFGTELGDEIFYCTFIPFWFWNIDGAVGRRIILVWCIVMTTGQTLKDIIRWPRPACPPAVRLQTKWSEEYGMPSTHAMIGVSIPFSVVLFTMNRYIYSLSIGFTIAFLWCTLVCTSRLYLGMHTVLDILAGLTLAITLMIPLVPLVDMIDDYIVCNIWALATLIAISICVIVYYPSGKKWTPTRGDTCMVVSVTTGVHLGSWLNYKTRVMLAPTIQPPYHIVWPSYLMYGCMILRTVVGLCSILAIRSLCKQFSYRTMCAILKINFKDLMNSKNYSKNKNTIFIDLVNKYLTCFMIGVNTLYLLPKVFPMIGIERSTLYTEI